MQDRLTANNTLVVVHTDLYTIASYIRTAIYCYVRSKLPLVALIEGDVQVLQLFTTIGLLPQGAKM